MSSPRPPVLRLATTHDRAAVLELWRALMAEHRDIPPGFELSARANVIAEEMFFDSDQPETQRLVLACGDDETPIGFAFGLLIHNAPVYDPPVIGCITDCYVVPEARSRGVGAALVGELKRWFGEQLIELVEVSVAAANTDALRFWRRVGGVDKFVRLELRTDS